MIPCTCLNAVLILLCLHLSIRLVQHITVWVKAIGTVVLLQAQPSHPAGKNCLSHFSYNYPRRFRACLFKNSYNFGNVDMP